MIKLYLTPSTRAGRVAWLLEELEMEYELEVLPFTKEGLKSPEHRSRHALGRVPVIEDGDVSIFESGAIIQYILDKYDDKGLKPDVNSSEYPYYLQWFHYCEGMVMPPMNQIVVQTVLLPPDRRDETVLNQAMNLLSKSLSPVNSFLEGKDYLIGNFSAADCMLGHSCFMAYRFGTVSDEIKNSYKYQGKLDLNNDGVLEAIFTNKVNGRWAAGKIDSVTGEIDYSDHGAGGGTRVVGIYDDPLIEVGLQNGGYLADGVTPAPAQFGATGSDRYTDLNGDGDFDDDNEDRLALNSQVRFQNDLLNDNLTVKTSGDFDGDGFQEVYWKTNNGDIYLRSLMHADGNIQYANYQNQVQMSEYLTPQGYENIIAEII